jgi:hypothetical protein
MPCVNACAGPTLFEPGFLVLREIASRVMRGQSVAVLEPLRVDHQIAAAPVLRGGEQNTFGAAFDRNVSKKPARWLDSNERWVASPKSEAW